MDLQAFVGKLTGNPEKDIKQLANFVFMQNEEIRYLLQNLDVTNFNDLGLARYENGRMQLYAEQVEIRAKTLQAVLEEEIDGLGQWVTEIEATAEGLKTTVSGYSTTIGELESKTEQTANKISAVVSSVGDKDGNVTAASIALAINNAGSTAMINADNIKMTGTTTFLSAADVGASGTTEIDGGRIKSGIIEGVTLKTRGTDRFDEIEISNKGIEIGAFGSIHRIKNQYGIEGADPEEGLHITEAQNIFLESSLGDVWLSTDDGSGAGKVKFRFWTGGIYVFDEDYKLIGEIPITRY